MTKPRTERYLILSGIHNFVQQVARYDRQKSAVKNNAFFHRTLIGFNDKLSL